MFICCTNTKATFIMLTSWPQYATQQQIQEAEVTMVTCYGKKHSRDIFELNVLMWYKLEIIRPKMQIIQCVLVLNTPEKWDKLNNIHSISLTQWMTKRSVFLCVCIWDRASWFSDANMPFNVTRLCTECTKCWALQNANNGSIMSCTKSFH